MRRLSLNKPAKPAAFEAAYAYRGSVSSTLSVYYFIIHHKYFFVNIKIENFKKNLPPFSCPIMRLMVLKNKKFAGAIIFLFFLILSIDKHNQKEYNVYYREIINAGIRKVRQHLTACIGGYSPYT